MAQDSTIPINRPTREALTEGLRNGASWLRSAASILHRQFDARGAAAEFEDRAQELANLVLAEEQALLSSPFIEAGMLNTKEAAAYCGLSHKTLEKYRYDGVGPAFVTRGEGHRGRVFYRPSDLDEWMARGAKVVQPAAE
jgi:hypothetical protein